MILHIPHASKVIPENELGAFLLTAAELEEEILRMTDHFTDELFVAFRPSTQVIRCPVSRLMVDPERFVDDQLEPMARLGMGVIYTMTSQGKKLRVLPSPGERKRLLESYYFPHHRRLKTAVDNELNKNGHALIIDCHSFPSRPRFYQTAPNAKRLDICLGTDAFHTPPWLLEPVVSGFSHAGLSVAVNDPYAGTMGPAAHYQTEPRVLSLMIEVNRALYMDENSGMKSPRFVDTKNLICTVLKQLEHH